VFDSVFHTVVLPPTAAVAAVVRDNDDGALLLLYSSFRCVVGRVLGPSLGANEGPSLGGVL